jgi:periplasmic divalent cation tolerance protein
MSVVSVTAIFANRDEARTIARTVIEERLAACANIIGDIESIYHWQGEIEESREVIALFKTTAAQADQLIARIAALHSYDVPSVLSAPVDKVLADYADWVAENVRV